MKNALIILFFCLCNAAFSQVNFVQINANYTIDLWKPFSKETQNFIQQGHSVTSKNSRDWNLLVTTIQNRKFSWLIGISYKQIDYRVKDRITEWAYTKSFDNNQVVDTFYYTFQDPADLVASSKSFGLSNQFTYLIHGEDKFKHFIGLDLNTFLFENYTSFYESNDIQKEDEPYENSKLQDDEKPYPNPGPIKHWFLSSVSASVMYKFFYVPTNYFSFGGKISIGTNLYSDWNQFQKYAWIGVGLEMGFGKLKLFK